MFLITSSGTHLNEKQWIEYLRMKHIDHVLIFRYITDNDPNYLSSSKEIEEYIQNNNISDQEAREIIKASEELHQRIKILNTLFIPYEYHEISKIMSKISIMAYLAKIIVSKNDFFIIDFSHGDRLLIPLFLTVSQLFSERIKEFISLDYRTDKYHSFPFLSITPDPDQRKSTTIKDILSLFLPDNENVFQNIPEHITLDSNQIIAKLPNLKSSHIKARLQFASTAQSGRTSLLNAYSFESDRRKNLFKLSETGLFILYITFLRYKYIVNNTEYKNEEWYTKVYNLYDNFGFI